MNEFFITRTRISKINRCFHFRIGNYYIKPRVPSIHLKENYTESKSNRTKSNYKTNDKKFRIFFKCNNVTDDFCVSNSVTAFLSFSLLQIKHGDGIFVNHVVYHSYYQTSTVHFLQCWFPLEDGNKRIDIQCVNKRLIYS